MQQLLLRSAVFGALIGLALGNEEAPLCTVCSEEAMPPPDYINKTLEESGLTCADWYNNLTAIKGEISAVDEDCLNIQINVGHLQCGCKPPSESCGLCWDGSYPSNPGGAFEVEETDEGFSKIATCGEAHEYALRSLEALSSECLFDFQFESVWRCGCPEFPVLEDPPGKAKLCRACAWDEDVPEENLGNIAYVDDLTGTSLNCSQFDELFAPYIGQTDETSTCYQAQSFLKETCGCPFWPELEDGSVCTPCEDGDLGSQEPNVVVWVDEESNTTYTCENIQAFMAFLEPGEEECNGFQALAAYYCGCNQPADSCTACPDGSTPTLDPDIIIYTDEETLETYTCADLPVIASFADSDDCTDIHIAAVLHCGCPVPDGDCTPCADEVSTPSTDNVTLIIPSEEYTCQDLPVLASFFDIENEECFGVQSVGNTSCGCPTLPVLPEGSCAPCLDGSYGSMDPNVAVSIDDETGEVMTCQTLLFAAAETGEEEETCTQIHGLATLFCGCPVPTSNCTVCADGSPPTDTSADTIVSQEGGVTITCAQLPALAAISGDAEASLASCEEVQSLGYGCGCPCSLCSSGGDVPPEFSDTEITDEDTGATNTCSALANSPFPVSSGEECFVAQFFTGSGQCGCGPYEGACSFCEDGLYPPDMDKVFSVDEETSNVTTCGDMIGAALFYGFLGEEVCTSLQIAGYAMCGCRTMPEVESNCTLCNEGDLPENFDVDTVAYVDVETGEELTCGTLLLGALSADKTSCPSIQVGGYLACGCSSLPEPGPANCTLCSDGVIPDGFDASAIAFVDGDTGEETTCGALLAAAFQLEEEETCPAIQVGGYLACGCSSLPEPGPGSCTLCSDGVIPDDFNASAVAFVDEDTGAVTCGALLAATFQLEEEETCPAIQVGGYIACGCASLPEPGPADCTLCSDGSIPVDFDPSTVAMGETTCGELLLFAFSAEEEDCPAIQYNGFSFCGCESLPDVNFTCPLCPDGTSVPYPDLQVQPTFTCGQAEFQIGLVDGGSSECFAFQATAGVYCNCSITEDTASACRLCGDDNLLPDPALLVSVGEESVTCGELEFEANENNTLCSDHQADYGPLCCIASSAKPSATPSTSPSSSLMPSAALEAPSSSPTSTTSPSRASSERPSAFHSSTPSVEASHSPSTNPSFSAGPSAATSSSPSTKPSSSARPSDGDSSAPSSVPSAAPAPTPTPPSPPTSAGDRTLLVVWSPFLFLSVACAVFSATL